MNNKLFLMLMVFGLSGNVFGMKSLKEKIGKHKKSSKASLDAAIIEAAKAADFERVCELHKQGAAINARDNEGNTPLHFAAFRDSEQIATFLLEKKASIHAQGGNERVPLHIASLIGAIKVGQLLLDQKDAKVDYRDADGISSLQMAASQNKLPFMQLLLEHGADLGAKDSRQKGLLHHAVQGGPDIVQFVVDRGAVIDARDVTEATPLRDAVIQKKIESARLLIELKADVDAKDVRGMSIVHHAAVADNEALVRLLVESKATVDALTIHNASSLHMAAQHASPAVLRYLVEQGADVNRKEIDKFTPLVFAVLAGKLENVRTLLELGADVTIEDGDGLTILTKLQTITVLRIENKKEIEQLLKEVLKNKK